MDFDYQRTKDVENVQREQRIGAILHQPQKPLTQKLSVQEPFNRQSPPVKPRRSLKLPKTSQTQIKDSQGLGTLQPLSPALRAQNLLWFQTKTQLLHLSQPGLPLPSWLHGFATRREAEDILKDKPQGCFLLRLSESKIGFVLSYRGKDRCRHFIIEEEEEGSNGRGGSYLITGEDSRHGSLSELVSYYTQNPVGPYDEMLTTPCDKSDKDSQETIKQWGQHACGLAEAPRGEYGDYKLTNPLSSPKTLISETGLQPSTSSVHTEKDSKAEYAIVRKVLRKSHSLPESQLSELSAHSLEAPNMNLSSQDKLQQSETGCARESGVEVSIDVQYAKVMKAPKVVPEATASRYVNINNLQVHQRAPGPSVPLPNPDFPGEPRYRQLEHVHTYEETPYLFQRENADKQMDFHSKEPGRDDQKIADSQHHLYAEVNLHGRRDCSSHIPFTERTAPSLPSRPPPSRAINIHPHPESPAQRSGEPLLSSSPSKTGILQSPYSERPLTSDQGASILKQISDRPISSRPPLPLPNPKRA